MAFKRSRVRLTLSPPPRRSKRNSACSDAFILRIQRQRLALSAAPRRGKANCAKGCLCGHPFCFDACRSLSQKILLCNIFWEPCFSKANFARGCYAQPLCFNPCGSFFPRINQKFLRGSPFLFCESIIAFSDAFIMRQRNAHNTFSSFPLG